ncbi:GRP family sugar transporter [Liquorilactobacillus mali]|uniref:Glucose uptake protein n=2 Tax=Liquorilactobacillus mali TaxID=1618 RepID=A0A0R2E402_9LACO|nr:GRP family sugar transporter [Liquorilactobacillus mali]KRN11071.1 glucose uptake protein [Liquorilactobacillus mali KCTC 3596 = DSM 20444]KRN30692.1 glucose uptake protein [Liquorilactobacillus mali]MDC7953816.1 glucose transporter GlcU [Liquorilactobacillus mali]MDN7145747.1 GRP family sugar transporter [Liquorilactobacillus mali]MDV7757522.1 glucose transporter GlcU [Liquorilactobacillus mali]
MGLLIGLIPALGWGFQSIVMQKVGGKFTNKVMGMVIGTTIMAIIIFMFHRPVVTADLLWGSILCGVFWSIGQILQVKSFDLLDISMAMPISTGEQLVGASLFGAIVFHEWTSGWQYVLGIASLIIIIIGIWLTTFQESKVNKNKNVKSGVIILTVSSLGFVGYALLPQIFNLNGWDVLMPQAIAMLISTSILVAFQKDNQMFGKKTFQNLLTGACFAAANLAILFSNAMNGVVVGWTLSQLNVVVATVGGLLILHEHKTKKELKFTLFGLSLVVLGAIMIGVTKQ